MKVVDLIGPALDWAVAKCDTKNGARFEDSRLYLLNDAGHRLVAGYSPSTDWSQGGLIIERENIELECREDWRGWMRFRTIPCYNDGPTPLIAAMRCYVASKLGDEIEVPLELALSEKP